jgi:hypothetical protein
MQFVNFKFLLLCLNKFKYLKESISQNVVYILVKKCISYKFSRFYTERQMPRTLEDTNGEFLKVKDTHLISQ